MNTTDLTFPEFLLALSLWFTAMIAGWNYATDLHNHQHIWKWFLYAVAAGPVYLGLVHLHRKLF